MSQGFWGKLKKPIFALAPMADVTDAAFRRLIAKYGKPDVVWTEFVSADGLFHTREKGKLSDEENPLMADLLYTEAERPIVAQFFTSKPDMMEYAASLARELRFDGVDINMGCPDRTIEKQGAGAALMKTPELARELVAAAKRGAGELPVSVKTRLGFNKNELDTWLPALLSAEPAVITVHARTRKEMSKVPAHWEAVARAVEVRDRAGSSALILGNGDVQSCAEAERKVEETHADGVMMGKAIFGNPWRFNREVAIETLPLSERLHTMVEHTKLFEELLGRFKNFALMKKHYKAYVTGWPGAHELRSKLMEVRTAHEVEAIVHDYLAHSSIAVDGV